MWAETSRINRIFFCSPNFRHQLANTFLSWSMDCHVKWFCLQPRPVVVFFSELGHFGSRDKNIIFYHQFLSHLYVCDCNCVPFLSCICIPLQSGRPLTDSLRGKVINFLLSHHKLHKGHCPEEVLYQTIINAFGRIFDISVLYLACFSIFMSITEQNTGDKFCHEPLLAATKKFTFISNLVSLVLAFPCCSM